MKTLPAFAALLLSASALAQERPVFTAVRTATPPKVNGRLDEPVWQTAVPYTDFIQTFPNEGAPASQRTEARVLYDDRFLYVGIRAYDDAPSGIVRTLGRRDSPPASDMVMVVVDASRDRRTGYSFLITAGGVLRDGLFFDDAKLSLEWDGVWEAHSHVDAEGWTAEFAIPLSLLRFPAAKEQVWNFHVRREVARTHEVMDSVLVPRTSNQFVSRFTELHGLSNLEPHRSVELLPYLAARAAYTPVSDADDRPTPRIWNPSADLGLDLRTNLTSNLALNATVNPDFGQVEADRLVLNLGTQEIFFPEKRPFFTQGLDLFLPAGAEGGRAPHMLFYSRRIGLDTPILGAAKVVGTVREGLQVGVLDAVVVGEPNRSFIGPAGVSASDDDPPDRAFRLRPGRPFHLGLENELPKERPVSRNFFAAVLRQQVLGQSRVGAMVTDATPLSKACYREDFATEQEFIDGDCEPVGQRAAAADFDLRTQDGAWGTFGQLAGSMQTGHAAPRTLRDGTVMRPGDTGVGGYLRAGKVGGEPFRAFVQYEYASPKLDLNSTGYVGSQNLQSLWGEARYLRSTEWGYLRELNVGVSAGRDWTTDGRGTIRATLLFASVDALLRNFVGVGVNCGLDLDQFDPREIEGAGIAFQRSPDVFCGGGFTTDETQPFSFHLDVFAFQNTPEGVLAAYAGGGASAWMTFRPTPRLETRLEVASERPALTAKYLEERTPDHFLFGTLLVSQTSATLRQQLVLTPELTLQAYAQLFVAAGHFGPFYEGVRDGDVLPMTALVRTDADAAMYDFRESALNLNVVLRWEYRLGSTFYAVYTRSQQSAPWSGEATWIPSLYGLGRGRTTDTFLLKWSYYWDAAL